MKISIKPARIKLKLPTTVKMIEPALSIITLQIWVP
jgi:hypothetical protein